jgi:hypothetical protein
MKQMMKGRGVMMAARKIPVLVPLLLCVSGALYGESAAEYNRQIQSLWDRNEHRKAHELTERALREYPGDAELIGRFGYEHKLLQIGDYGVTYLEKAYALRPDDASIKYWIVDAYLASGWHNSGDADKCEALWSRALEIDPDQKDYYVQMAWILSQTKNPERALHWYDRALARNYDKQNLWADRGNAYRILKRWDDSRRDLDRALAMNPSYGWAMHAYAWLESDRGNRDAWREKMETLLSWSGNEYLGRYEVSLREELGRGCRSDGHFAKSIGQYRALLGKYPGHENAKSWRDELFWASDKTVTILYTVEVKEGSPGAPVKVMLPVQTGYQQITRAVFTPAPQKTVLTSLWGNTVAELSYREAPEKIDVAVHMALKSVSLAEGGFAYNNTEDDPARHLLKMTDSNVIIDPQSPRLTKMVREICGDEREPLKKARLLFDWSWKNMTYKVVFPNSMEEYLDRKEAECGGYAHVFQALCRAAGIPARRVFSPILEAPDDKTFGSHETSEFYLQGTGWVPVNNTFNVFGSTSAVISLWRQMPDGMAEPGLSPTLREITVEYRKPDGRKCRIRGG